MEFWKSFFILSLLAALNLFALWNRYKTGLFLSAPSGLHLQILIFYCLGGFAFLGFPDAEPKLADYEILQGIGRYCLPLLFGYSIAVFWEYRTIRSLPRQIIGATITGSNFSPGLLFFIATLGFAGCVLEGRLNNTIFSATPIYIKNLFFPCFLLALLNWTKYTVSGKFVALIIFAMALTSGIWSAWRSILVILSASIMMGAVLIAPRRTPLVLIAGTFIMSILIPFQVLKRGDYEKFRSNPFQTLTETFDLSKEERFEMIGNFTALRINYTRELTYVNRAIESGMELRHGETYVGIFYQLIPRAFWRSKPQLASWAGFELPRHVGLVQEVDPNTSWAVNMFAEATYNFGLWCLVWFVPLIFRLSELVSVILNAVCRSQQALWLGNIAFFYLFLSQTTVIFAASLAVAMFIVVKCIDALSNAGRLSSFAQRM
jgi:hypothetical protein